MMPLNIDKREISARADAWHALSTLFLFPASGQDALVAASAKLRTALVSLEHPSLPAATAFETLVAQTDFQEWCVEFTRLYIGPFQTACPPYASFYLEEGKLMGESTIAVMKAYIASGVMIQGRFKDLPDHVAAEFEFMYYLLSNISDLMETAALPIIEEIRSVQDAFLGDHVGMWLPTFCEAITRHTHLDGFLSLAELTAGFVDAEIRFHKHAQG